MLELFIAKVAPNHRGRRFHVGLKKRPIRILAFALVSCAKSNERMRRSAMRGKRSPGRAPWYQGVLANVQAALVYAPLVVDLLVVDPVFEFLLVHPWTSMVFRLSSLVVKLPPSTSYWAAFALLSVLYAWYFLTSRPSSRRGRSLAPYFAYFVVSIFNLPAGIALHPSTVLANVFLSGPVATKLHYQLWLLRPGIPALTWSHLFTTIAVVLCHSNERAGRQQIEGMGWSRIVGQWFGNSSATRDHGLARHDEQSGTNGMSSGANSHTSTAQVEHLQDPRNPGHVSVVLTDALPGTVAFLRGVAALETLYEVFIEERSSEQSIIQEGEEPFQWECEGRVLPLAEVCT